MILLLINVCVCNEILLMIILLMINDNNINVYEIY